MSELLPIYIILLLLSTLIIYHCTVLDLKVIQVVATDIKIPENYPILISYLNFT